MKIRAIIAEKIGIIKILR